MKESENKFPIFCNPDFGEVRSVIINGKPWFVLKDVCAAFGDTNYRRISSRLDDDEKGVSQIKTTGGVQSMTIINESGLYSALLSMQPQKARGVSETYIAERQQKLLAFQRWLTHDVLPSIRKYGGYAMPDIVDKLAENPDEAIEMLMRYKEEREKKRTAARSSAQVE